MRGIEHSELGTWTALMGAALCLFVDSGMAQVSIRTYIDDSQNNRFAALMEGRAFELHGCEDAQAALALLEMSSDTEVIYMPFAELEASYGLGRDPQVRIPCPGIEPTLDIPLVAPLWLDADGSRSLYLEHPVGEGVFYQIPLRCRGLHKAFDIGRRVLESDVLPQETAPPQESVRRIFLLSCGSTSEEPVTPKPELGWRLMMGEMWLGASRGKVYVYIAEYRSEDTEPVYITVHSFDNRSVDTFLWDTDTSREDVEDLETRLLSLFRIPGPIGARTADVVRRAQAFPIVEVCLDTCSSLDDSVEHLYFPQPDNPELKSIRQLQIEPLLSTQGNALQVWSFVTDGTSVNTDSGTQLVFQDCDSLLRSLRLTLAPTSNQDWIAQMNEAQSREMGGSSRLVCPPKPGTLCTRRVPAGREITSSLLQATGDCRGRTRLELNLEGDATLEEGQLAHPSRGFDQVIVRGAETGSQLTIATSNQGNENGLFSRCYPYSRRALVRAAGIDHLLLRDLTLLSSDQAHDLAIEIENARVVLQHVSIGTAEDSRPQVGIRLCLGEMYAWESSIRAERFGIRGIASRLLLVGNNQTAELISDQIGIELSTDSQAVLRKARVKAGEAVKLLHSRLEATHLSMEASSQEQQPTVALWMRSGASALLKFSSIASFDYVASCSLSDDIVRVLLPTNDVEADNGALQDGPECLQLE